MGTVRPARLEANDTSDATTSSPPASRRLLDPFRFSIPNTNWDTFLEDKDDELLPAPTHQPNAPAVPARTPVYPAPAPPSPSFHTPETLPTGAREEPTRPLSPAASSPDIYTDVPTAPANLPHASSTSRLTCTTAKPDDVLEYVYDQLPLEHRLAKLFKKKQQTPKKWRICTLNFYFYFLLLYCSGGSKSVFPIVLSLSSPCLKFTLTH